MFEIILYYSQSLFSDVGIFMKIEIKATVQFWCLEKSLFNDVFIGKTMLIGSESAVYGLRDQQRAVLVGYQHPEGKGQLFYLLAGLL